MDKVDKTLSGDNYEKKVDRELVAMVAVYKTSEGFETEVIQP